MNIATTTYYAVGVFDNAAWNRGIWLGYDSTGTVGAIGADNGVGASSLAFVAHNGTVHGEKMRIDGSTGNVGIGTNSPTYNLHVLNDINGSAHVAIENPNVGASADANFTVKNNVGYVSFGMNGSGQNPGNYAYVYNHANGGIVFGSNGFERMRLDNTGDFGIGTTSPGAKLDVKGHIANSGASASIGTCGTSPAITGNDTRGVITLGTGSPTACTITFAAAYGTAPYCVITAYGGNPGAVQWWITTSTTTLVLSFSASPTASQQFQYHCMQ